MRLFSFFLDDRHHEGLRAASARDGRPMGEHLRRMMDALLPAHLGMVSGAAVVGYDVTLRTVSGSIRVKGF